jgi:hypothetical protein
MKIPTSLVFGLHSLSLGVVVGGTPLPQKPASIADGTVILPQATLKGFKDAHGNTVFLGVPFAATTGGENRLVIYRISRDHQLMTYADGKLLRMSRT